MKRRIFLLGSLITAALALAVYLLRRRTDEAEGTAPPAPASLLHLIACPACRGVLDWEAGAAAFRCDACRRHYPVRDGIVHFIEPSELTGMNRRFAFLYDWFSWVYRAFAKIAFAFIGITEAEARGELVDPLRAEGGRVLEVSIGPGNNLPHLFRRGGAREVHGLDISMGQLRRCRGYAQRNGWSVPLYLANAEALPFRDGVFDAVLHVGGINFFGDKARAMSEMARVARPGARIVIADENERGARGYERTLPGFKRSFEGGRPPVVAPVVDLPPRMEDVRVRDCWNGWFYSLEFTKPEPGHGGE